MTAVRCIDGATRCQRAEGVLTFLGRKLHDGFAGEILNEWNAGGPVDHHTCTGTPWSRSSVRISNAARWRVEGHARLGGLLNFYDREAA